MASLHEEDNHIIEDKRKDKVQKAGTYQKWKRHLLHVNLLLWHEIVAMRYFVWPLYSGNYDQADQKLGIGN